MIEMLEFKKKKNFRLGKGVERVEKGIEKES